MAMAGNYRGPARKSGDGLETPRRERESGQSKALLTAQGSRLRGGEGCLARLKAADGHTRSGVLETKIKEERKWPTKKSASS